MLLRTGHLDRGHSLLPSPLSPLPGVGRAERMALEIGNDERKASVAPCRASCVGCGAPAFDAGG